MNDSARSRWRDRGSASLELIAMLPLLVLVGLLCLQVAAAMWVQTSVTEAARSAARAYSLGFSPAAAAQASLPGGLRITSLAVVGPGHGVRLTVGVPRVSPIPAFSVTRTVAMP